jgi:hypothetical protein
MSCYVNLWEGGWKSENPHNRTFPCVKTHHFSLIFKMKNKNCNFRNEEGPIQTILSFPNFESSNFWR